MSSSAQDKFPITAAQLSGNFSETLFYGMYLVTCCFCAHTLFFTDDGRGDRLLRVHEIRWMMVFIAVALFVICTFDVAIGLLHNFHAFIEARDAAEEFSHIGDWINIARSVNQFTAMLLGDFVLIYRCWIVYGRRWLIIVPSLILYLGGIAMTSRLIQVEAHLAKTPNITLTSSEIQPWWLAFFGITAVQNTLTTAILVWRIWRVDSESSRYLSHTGSIVNRPRHLQKVIRVIAESGAAYTLMVFLTFIVSIFQNNALYPMSDMTLQATGIAFNVILVRSSAGRDKQFTAFDRTLTVGQTGIGPGGVSVGGGGTIGSVNLSQQSHGRKFSGGGRGSPEDLEMGVKSSRSPMDRHSDMDIFPGGIRVTKVVHSS